MAGVFPLRSWHENTAEKNKNQKKNALIKNKNNNILYINARREEFSFWLFCFINIF